MTETNNTPAPEEKKQEPVQPEGELRAELARVRGRNKIFKAVIAVFLSLFIILVVAAFLVYRKISDTKAAFEDAFRAFPPPPAYQQENRMLAVQGVYNSTSMPASTLGLFAGGGPDSADGNPNPGQNAQVVKVMEKYVNRPIMKEFIADLKKNPDLAAVFTAGGGNPLAMLGSVQKARGIDKLLLKYSTRPEFMKLLMEFMNDPEIKPLMKGMPTGMPQGMQQGAAIPAPSGPPSQPPDKDDGREMTFDQSVISGPARPAPVTSPKPPPPIDSN